ncbi:LacI family DNA-binding transcriptional regulator [Microbacterium sp. RURRCA19A]|uniref:LacI family DNA-binding transcriptional regulator n=1 Tax=Microbacterium sp. RURRCA19A TaxID=1907391 RepID=UPI000953EF4A|nr:LacI family DNA-binding transcriptional regulator [Microbacterium sp. RURRCA19A]SIS11141.1 DNA-binding transcriptional regulator, LacI/PurR family [Microbacterium sp. RURRCA19A]
MTVTPRPHATTSSGAEVSRRRPTIEDVAAVSGVSRGTVSRVLNGKRWVSPESRDAVLAAIKSTGYRANVAARTLASSRSRSIAFLLTEPQQLLFEDRNLAKVLQGCGDALGEQELTLVMLTAATDAEKTRALDFLAGGAVDGVLIVSTHEGNRDLIRSITDLGLPLVVFGVPFGFEHSVSYVTVDDVSGSRAMMNLLLGLGRDKVGMIAGPQDMSGGRDRLAGYREALGADFDPTLVEFGDFSRDSGATAMRALLARHPDLGAVFAANDRMARAAIEVLVASGRRVPEDVAVGGFDDAPEAVESHPHLTTLDQPFDRLSREGVRLLGEMIEGSGVAAVRLPATLIERRSTAR